MAADAVVCAVCETAQRRDSNATTIDADASAEPTTPTGTATPDNTPSHAPTPLPAENMANLCAPKQNAAPHRGVHFTIGFLGAGLLMGFVIARALSSFPRNGDMGAVIVAGGFLLLLMVCAFAGGLRHIGFGILTVLGIVVAIPLLLLGACFAAASGCR